MQRSKLKQQSMGNSPPQGAWQSVPGESSKLAASGDTMLPRVGIYIQGCAGVFPS